jgi:hypothetical protein
MENPLKYFAELKDPRVERTREHLLEEILLMAIAAILSGANGWNEIENYGKAKREWLSSFLRLPGGIPSHDTFNRVFAALATEELEESFATWVGSIARLTAGEVVAIDGKTLRGTRTTAGKALVHMVSAWANSNNLVLAQRKADDKSNEITAIPKLLKALELSGGDHRCHRLPEVHCQPDRHPAGRLRAGGEGKSAVAAGRHHAGRSQHR